MVSGLELTDNFAEANFEAQGVDLAELYAGNPLPTGSYDWEVYAIETYRNRLVSNLATARMTISVNQPPQLNAPANNAIISPTAPQNLLFSWAPRHTANPALAAGVIYTIYLYELNEDDDLNGVATSGAPPFRIIETSNPNYLYGPSEVPLNRGKRYAWQVQVSDLAGREGFQNSGFSEVQNFKYGDKACPVPTGLSHSIIDSDDEGEVNISWDATPDAQAYELKISSDGEADKIVRLTETSYLWLQAPRGKPHAYALRTICDAVSQSPWTATNTFQLKENAWVSDPSVVYTVDTVGLVDPVVDSLITDEDPPLGARGLSEILNTPIKIIIPADGSETLPEGVPDAFPVLPANPSIEQLQTALKRLKPTCAGIEAAYVCGNHDAVPQYSGEVISITSGDDIAMNSMVISVVEIDGAGNGTGIIKVGMLNNAKLGVALSGIKVAKGGCIIAGKAELNDLAISVLSDKQREILAKSYAAFQTATDAAIENAGAVAEVYNDIAAALKAVREKAKAIITKQNNGEKLTKKELQTLKNLVKVGLAAKKQELDLLKKTPGSDTSKYVAALSQWLTNGENCKPCLEEMIAVAGKTPPKSKGPANFDDYYFVACSIEALTVDEPLPEPPIVIAPLIAYALKKMAEAGTGALLDGIVQYSVFKYSEGLDWEAAWDKIEFDKSSMFFSGISSMVKNKALSVGIDAVGSVVSYVVETPSEEITMNQVLIELGRGAGMGLISNFGGDAVRAVSNKIGADKVTEGFIRLCKDLNIGKETSEKVSKVLDGIVDKKKFDDIWEKVFGRVITLKAFDKINGQTNPLAALAGAFKETINRKYKVFIKETGFPDFTPWSKKDVNIKMIGNYDTDFASANYAAFKEIFEKNKIDINSPKARNVHLWAEDGKFKDYTWHHHENLKTMQLVPKDLNNPGDKGLYHFGGVSIINHNKNYPNKKILINE